jgi:hypothetical protein
MPQEDIAMSHDHEDIARKSRAFREKFRDRELDAYLESITRRLEDADTLYHHFGHLLKHVRASVAHPVRPKHLQGAIEKAERCLKRFEAERT